MVLYFSIESGKITKVSVNGRIMVEALFFFEVTPPTSSLVSMSSKNLLHWTAGLRFLIFPRKSEVERGGSFCKISEGGVPRRSRPAWPRGPCTAEGFKVARETFRMGRGFDAVFGVEAWPCFGGIPRRYAVTRWLNWECYSCLQGTNMSM
jgi:hypothetical protein